MTIHRVRLPRQREWREERAELRLRAKGRVLDARLAAELRARVTAEQPEAPPEQ
jgi:hypothetical protein